MIHGKLISTRSRSGVTDLARAACLCTLGDSSALAERIFTLAIRQAGTLYIPAGARTRDLGNNDRLSGIDLKHRRLRMGRPDQVAIWLAGEGKTLGSEVIRHLDEVADTEAPEPVLVADQDGDLGLIQLAQASEALRWRQPGLEHTPNAIPILVGAFSRLPGMI